MLIGCFNPVKYKRSEFQMWSKYHQLRISEAYTTFWKTFITETTGNPASPIFYQYLGNKLFHALIKEYYVISICEERGRGQPPLMYLEINA